MIDVYGIITARNHIYLQQGYDIDFNNGTNGGTIAQASSAGNYSSSASTGDFVLRSSTGKNLMLQQGSGPAAMCISTKIMLVLIVEVLLIIL